MQISITRGLDIPLAGEPEQSVKASPPIQHVALCGLDYVGIKPRLQVAEGDKVGPLQALFVDKRDPAVQYCAPGRGTVVSINRGARRVLHSVVLELEDSNTQETVFEALSEEQVNRLLREEIVSRLLQAGLWPAFRTRPFSQVPHSQSRPRSIFVTAMDTRPLAADPRVAIRAETDAFAAGLHVMSRLTRGTVNLCTAPEWDIALPDLEGVRIARFAGPHPAGLPGTHIHHLYPVSLNRVVWHIGYPDIIAIGKLFRSGVIDYNRIVAISGASVVEPRLVRTRLGASIVDLTRGQIRDPDSCRVISGSVLGGRAAGKNLSYLGRYHEQVSVIEEGGGRRFMGWTDILPHRYSAARTFKRKTGHRFRFALPTSQNGRFTGMIAMRAFEKVMPLDILPSPLFRALLVSDTDQAQNLGCLELDEEDVALCAFVCPAKIDYGLFLRLNLNQIEREG
ncbi:MAG: Na(+)-translocating NADH-quinone reductase subunit A [Xanthomonadales bacterium]|nr:Na(+)-translocating NADH-quinone reductase subunit A [Gammaproteobacteria bacterium]MBT8055177.1 Na(+)-translocating NADH-quinone reductase subunit A [Gammaproteobacteria bacterium]NND55827.1 Na(+)-translocating NADH-quinone reductase subunit A [Xanthomonadales bacterium]NNK51370.1 Na(+)-translocating NADH-quinone reductase subunit A [Xanthomonadales bacterium]